MPSQVHHFDLTGPTWLNVTCLLIAGLIFLPMGLLIAYDGYAKRRVRDIVLGLGVAIFMLVAVVWIPLEEPARLTISDSELILDYRWPRPDRRVAIRSITAVEYYTARYRGRRGVPQSSTQLRVSIADGDTVKIQPPGVRANWDNFRAAAAALSERANVQLAETVEDNR